MAAAPPPLPPPPPVTLADLLKWGGLAPADAHNVASTPVAERPYSAILVTPNVAPPRPNRAARRAARAKRRNR